MITDDDIEKAIDYLRDNATAAAQSRANRIYMDEFRKSLKALIMKEHVDLQVSAQEREAYADSRMLKHLDALRHATHQYEKHRFTREAQLAKIEAWRTYHANLRSIKL